MEDAEALPEGSAIDDPKQIAVEGLSGEALRIRHRRVLYLDVDARWCLDVGSVYLAVGGLVVDFPAMFREPVLPIAVPLSLVLPPRVAVPLAPVGPMVEHTRTTLGDHDGITDGATASPPGKRLDSLPVDYGELHNLARSRYQPQVYSTVPHEAHATRVGKAIATQTHCRPEVTRAGEIPIPRCCFDGLSETDKAEAHESGAERRIW